MSPRELPAAPARVPAPGLALAAGLLLVIAIYALLMVGDWLLGRRANAAPGNGAATALEARRAAEEDRPQVEAARAAGYATLLFPEVFDHGQWRQLALRHGIAPLAPQPATAVYQCNEGYGLVRYRSDRYGFRNPDALWDQDAPRVMLVGDSYVHGACVDDASTIAAVMNAHGQPTLSLGSGGNSPIHYAALVRTFAPVVRPATLVVVFYPNDNLSGEERSVFSEFYFRHPVDYFAAAAGEQRTPPLSPALLQLYRDAEALLAAERREPGSTTADLPMPLWRRVTGAALRMARLSNVRAALSALPLLRGAGMALPYGSRLAIDTAAAECRRLGCRVVIAFLPNSDFWRPDHRAPTYASALRDYGERRGAGFADLRPVLEPLGAAAYAPKGPHLSPAGYAAVAGVLAEASGGGSALFR